MRHYASAEDSVEIALAFFKACGAYLQDVNNAGYQRWAQRLLLHLAGLARALRESLATLQGSFGAWPGLAVSEGLLQCEYLLSALHRLSNVLVQCHDVAA